MDGNAHLLTPLLPVIAIASYLTEAPASPPAATPRAQPAPAAPPAAERKKD